MALSKQQQIMAMQLEIEIEEEELALAKAKASEAEIQQTTPPLADEISLEQAVAPEQPLTASQDITRVEERDARGLDIGQQARQAELDNKNMRRRYPEEPVANVAIGDNGEYLPASFAEEGAKEKTYQKGLSLIEKAGDVFFTQDAETGGAKAMGLLSFPARALGASLGKGSISKEDTKLLKGTIKELNDWARDRKNANTDADMMIDSLQQALDSSENMAPDVLQGIQEEIDRLEDSKNSGIRTTATQVLGNFGLETTSDPLFLLDFAANLRNILKTGIGTASRSGVKESLKAGKAAEKSAVQNIVESKMGTSKAGKVEDFVGAGGGEEIVSRLKSQGIDIDEAGISIPENVFSGKLGKIRKQGRAQDEATEAALTASRDKELADVTSEFKGETGAIRQRAREATEGAPSKVGIKESDVTISDLDNNIEEFRKSLTSERKPIEQLNLVKKVRKSTDLKPEHKSEIIRDLLKSNSGDFSELDEVANALSSMAKPSRRDIGDLLRKYKFRRGADDLADAVMFIKQGDLESANKVIDRLDEILVSAVKPSAKQKNIESASPARIIKGKMQEFSDEVLREKMGDEMFAELQEISKVGGQIFGAEKSALKAFNISPTERNILEFGGKTEAVKKMRKAIDDEAKDFVSAGLKDTDSMKRGEWEQWKKFLGKDFRKEIRVKGAKIVEADIRKAIESGKITDELASKSKDVDVILNTNLSKKIDSMAKRSDAASAASAIRTPIKRLAKAFEDRVNAINKTFSKKLSKLEPSKNNQITSILKLAKTGDTLQDTQAMTKALKNKFLDAVEDVADGQKNSGAMQALKEIDKALGSSYEKMAKDAGRAAGFNLDVMGKVRKSSVGDGGIPAVSISVAGALGGPVAVKAAGASQIARKVAVSIKGKKAERAIKEIFKLKKANAKRSQELRDALKDIRAGKDVLARELYKGNFARNLDVLVKKGVVPITSIKSILSKEELSEFIEKNRDSVDMRVRNLIKKLERK